MNYSYSILPTWYVTLVGVPPGPKLVPTIVTVCEPVTLNAATSTPLAPTIDVTAGKLYMDVVSGTDAMDACNKSTVSAHVRSAPTPAILVHWISVWDTVTLQSVAI